MKKAKVTIIILAVLLLIALFPIPSKQSGSKAYTSLTYKVVKWNREMADDLIYDSIDFYLLPDNFKSVDELWQEKNTEPSDYSSDYVSSIEILTASTDTESSAADDENICLTNSDLTSSDAEEHTNKPSNESSEEAPIGYCGNTQSTIYFDDDKSFTFMGSESVAVTDILLKLEYDKSKLCRCASEYRIDTEYGTGYGVNLSEGYARSDKGQADLSKVQIDRLREIILWAKDKAN